MQEFVAFTIVLHDAHTPPQHSPFVPHAVLLGALPVATHVSCPVLQDVIPPVSQAFDRVHATPAVQATQLPLLQT
jgi:hypothetical protein